MNGIKLTKAKWITDLSYMSGKKESPVPLTFRRDFALKSKIQKASITATAMGIYTMELNGKRVEDTYFAPYFTSYAHRLQYQNYDITALLESENRLTVVVGGGWAVGRFNLSNNAHITEDRQALLLELTLLYEDGTAETIPTDESWQVTTEGTYRFADWYDGEVYDSTVNLEQISWKQAGVAKLRHHPELLPQYGEYVTVHEVLTPVTGAVSPNGELIFDFGQNFAGVIRATLRGTKGQTIVFRHAEVLQGGELFTRPLRTAKAMATYIASDGEQVYSPRLTSMGFRYVGVRGIDSKDIRLEGLVLHSNFAEIGGFSCSDGDINRLQNNIRWGGKSNFIDIPTDCPQRDERLGWTGDIALFARTACFNFDMSKFFRKWLLDVKAEQGKGGGIPMVVPNQGYYMPTMATSCWGDCCVLVPWAEYMARGDIELLKEQYPVMKKFLKAAKFWSELFSFTKTDRRIWALLFHFGDWCAPGEEARDWLSKGPWIGTAYFANSCGIVAEIAGILGYEEEQKYYLRLRKEICEAYLKKFTDGHGKLKKEFQTAYVLPLYFHMVEGETRTAMAANLARLVRENEYHLSTGFTGTPYLLFALADNGYAEEAYRVLLQDTCPGWLYEVKAGATTIWERWDALRPDGTVNLGELRESKEEEADGGMVSFNHYANGAVGDFLYRRVAGIEAVEAGYRKMRICPIPGGGLTHAEAYTHCPYGKIASAWKIEGDVFTLTAEIPQGCEGEIVLPDGSSRQAAGGVHTFSCKILKAES